MDYVNKNHDLLITKRNIFKKMWNRTKDYKKKEFGGYKYKEQGIAGGEKFN